MNLNKLAAKIHNNAKKHGWWDEERSLPEVMMLVVTEVAEVVEEARNGHESREIYYVDTKPEGIPIEIADAMIRLLDYCAHANIDIDDAMKTKMNYNKSRPYRHGGKKY